MVQPLFSGFIVADTRNEVTEKTEKILITSRTKSESGPVEKAPVTTAQLIEEINPVIQGWGKLSTSISNNIRDGVVANISAEPHRFLVTYFNKVGISGCNASCF